ncbi:MAG: 1-acyl-sn-glycerol-3-phosphate acyltransferase [Clostridiaceae bacterium]|jgi:1-acyl-sn-glycerol-3-phosphate acyltransferase|nr:1-acyl-sn-glycerol-3-phosphate acyltransferase [Clostridiaceae bacterium]
MSLYRFFRAVFSPFVRLLWPVKILGVENFTSLEGGALIICNHYSIADTLITAVRLYKKELNVLAKHEAFKKKIGKWFLTKIGAIPVRRGEPDINAYKEIMRRLTADKKVVMYPEGTRNKAGTHELQEFKQGAALFAIRSGKPILPMVYYEKHRVFHRNYLLIGEPFMLDKYAGRKHADIIEEATAEVFGHMNEIRTEVDAIVEAKKGKALPKAEADS